MFLPICSFDSFWESLQFDNRFWLLQFIFNVSINKLKENGCVLLRECLFFITPQFIACRKKKKRSSINRLQYSNIKARTWFYQFYVNFKFSVNCVPVKRYLISRWWKPWSWGFNYFVRNIDYNSIRISKLTLFLIFFLSF